MRLPSDGALPLSFGQERVWFLDQLQPESVFYNHLDIIAFYGVLDVETLRRSLELIINRHEILRATFPVVDGIPAQRITPPAPLSLPVTDVRRNGGGATPLESARLVAAADAKTRFDLVTGPLFRTKLLRLADDEHLLVFTVHHIAWDGWSLGLFIQELTTAYAALVRGVPPTLPDLPVQYADFAHWQRQLLTGEVLEAHRVYWRETLGGPLPTLDLPFDRPRPASRTFEGAPHTVVVDGDLLTGLRALSRREGVTLYTTFLTAFKTLLLRYTGQPDVMVGTLVAGRVRPEIEHAIGFFVNTLALRTDLSSDPPFREALRRTRDVVLSAHAHADFPFEKLVAELHPERDLSRNPLLQVFLNMLNIRMWEDTLLPGLRIRSLPTLDLHAVADGLTLFAYEGPDRLELCFTYPTELFEQETIARMASHLLTLLASAVADPDQRLAALPLLPVEEGRAIDALEVGAGRVFPVTATLPRLFEAQARARPDAVALTCQGTDMSYGELDARANRVADHLRSLDVGPDVLVGLCAERSIDLVVGLLGILKAGGAYVPLDPSYPQDRLTFMLADAELSVVVTHRAARAALPDSMTSTVVLLDELEGDPGRSSLEPRVAEVAPEHLAYVIYTSGSTGNPKGVLVSHANVVRLLAATEEWFRFGPADVWTLFHSFAFDFSVWELWGALAYGGRVVIVPYETSRDPRAFVELLTGERVTVLNQTPSAFRQLITADLERDVPTPFALRLVIFGGEALELSSLRPWIARYGDDRPRLVNMYGITETCVHVTYRPLTGAEVVGGTASVIGVPIPDLRIHLRDASGKPVPFGLPGEMYIGGAGVARGYLNRPELTAERFLDDPLQPGRRLYRSGDLARRTPTGDLVYLGRMDEQVKIRGFRIELGEIEATLARHPAVREVVVVARPGGHGDPSLVAYLGLGQDIPSPADLRQFLARSLPGYMIPETFVPLPTLPLTPNGKIDRRSLPAPTAAVSTPSSASPRTLVEELIANVWAEMLGVEQVGINDSFFELGGHSLLAARVASRLREALDIDLPVRRIFEQPTVAELAHHVEAARRNVAHGGLGPLRAVARVGALPLSFAQQRLWFFDQLEPNSSVFNLPLPLRMCGRLDLEALGACLDEIKRRHETLRTTFSSTDGVPEQRIAPPTSWPIAIVDLRAFDDDARRLEAERVSLEEAERPFDLARGPLVRARLLRLEDELHWLLVTFHHSVADGWSLNVFMRELATLYESRVTGQPAALPALPVQYVDVAACQREWLTSEGLAAQLAYWTRQLAGAPPVLDLPLDSPRPTVQTFRGGVCLRRVEPLLRDRLHALSRRENATLFMTLLAAFSVVLSRQSGQDDICVGVPIAGRGQTEVENLIGLFLNTLVLRVHLSGQPTFRTLLRQVRETALDGFAHQDVPFEKVVETLQPARDLGRTPLFQVMFNMVSFGHSTTVELPSLHVELALPSGAWTVPSKFDLTLYVRDDAEELALSVVYNANLFAASRIEALVDQFIAVLSAVVAEPDADVAGVPLVTAAMRAPVDRALPLARQWTESFPARFRHNAGRAPMHPAVVDITTTLTYGELDRLSNQLANYLVAGGIGRENRVAILAERSAGLAWAMLGVAKAGAGFMCLDPAYPAARLVRCLQTAPPQAWIDVTGRPLYPELAEHLASLEGVISATWPVDGGRACQAWRQCAAAPPLDRDPVADDLAYVVFTSGSTGAPKAIAGTHGPLSHFFAWHARANNLLPEDRFAVLSGLAHDPLLRDVLGALWVGATACMPESGRIGAPGYLASWLAAQRVTVAHVTPAMAALLADDVEGDAARPLDTLRHVFFGGDVLTRETVARVRQLAPHATCTNFYGATETPQAIAWYRVPHEPAEPYGRIPLGIGIDDVQLLVLNAAGGLAGLGEIGEIHVRTPYLARGYVGDPGLTAERFGVSPFGAADDRMYRTGDLGRYRSDGTVEFCGRRDHQVKLRGFRIELGEIEAALEEHAAVREAVALVREVAKQGHQLVAYVVTEEDGKALGWELREQLRRRLPEYMVPTAIVPLTTLPLSPNGKVDRTALPAPEGVAAGRDHVAPRTVTEKVVAGIWAEVLGVERVGVADDFFELGGHSLIATRLVARVQRALGISLALRCVFENPTVAGQAEMVERSRREMEVSAAPPPLQPVDRKRQLPLSFGQQRLWFLDQLEPGNPAYNGLGAVRLVGDLDLQALEQALNDLQRRHEVLRTVITEEEGRPWQVVQPALRWRLPVEDLSGDPRPDEALQLLARKEAHAPFDLERGPVWRARLVRLGPREHVLLTVTHHIASDGWSVGVMIREIGALYTAALKGERAALPALPIQYADYAHWQHEWLESAALEASLGFWKRQLAGSPSGLDLPADRPRPAVQSFHGAREWWVIPRDLLERVRKLGRQENATLFMTLLTAFDVLLSRYSGQEDIVVGSPIANRTRPELEGLVGFFVNMLALRTDLSGDPTVREVLRRVREMTLDAYTHQDMPFERLVEALRPPRDLGRPPLFQVLFVLQNAPMTALELPELRVEVVDVAPGLARFDLTVSCAERSDGLAVCWEYNTDLFDGETVRQMMRHFEHLLEGMTDEPDCRIGTLPLLTETERTEILAKWNGTERPYLLAQCLHDLVARQAAATPERVAVEYEGRELTYEALERRANQLAHRLRAIGAGPDVLVGVCMERSLELVVALLGILKAGAAYVPLDPTYPAERLAYMTGDAEAPIVVTQPHLRDAAPWGGAQVVELDATWEAIAGEKDTPVTSGVGSEHLAYTIYTSGSTGQPKGAMNTHGGIVNRLLWMQEAYGLGADDRVLQKTPFSFDVSVWEFFWPLLAGARLVIARPEGHKDSGYLVDVITGRGITTVHFVPSMLRVFLEEPGAGQCTSLRRVIASGEALPVEVVDRFFALELPAELHNLYGPTEAAVDVTAWACRRADRRRSIPIGRPIANTKIHILDARGEPVPVGVAGELHIGGVGLARGYWRRPELTAEKFIRDPFGSVPGARLYRTGDLARYLASGDIEYLGRLDHQVKLRGFRIELGEIEAALAGHPSVRNVTVVAREDVGRDKRLVAYIVTGEDAPSPSELRQFLARTLPEYMVPEAFVTLPVVPLTPNGKVDRGALPAPEVASAERGYTPPRTGTEQSLAAIWAQVLRVERVGSEDDFFALGGHSLLASQVMARVRTEFGVSVTLRSLFDAPTVAGLATVIDTWRLAVAVSSPVVGNGKREEIEL
jgi:amino acid adenylation domain-containing protein